MKTNNLPLVNTFKIIAKQNQQLSREEQNNLFRTYKNQDLPYRVRIEARDALLFSTYAMCLKLVTSRKLDHMINKEDALIVCVEAQFKALEIFNPDRGVSFSTYLYTWLRSYLLTALKQMRVVKLPNKISLADSALRISMTGQEKDFEFSNEDVLLQYSITPP